MASVFTSENIGKYLEETNRDIYGRRTWGSAFGSINLNANQAIENLSVGYGEKFGEAYATAKENEAAISTSALGQGYKNAAIEENEAALEAAYDAYLKNYVSDIGTVENARSQQLDVVAEQLRSQAESATAYTNSQVDYLNDLLSKVEAGEISSDLFSRFDYEEYFEPQIGEDGNIMTDENGNPLMAPKSMDAIRSEFFDPITGQMTTKGWRFFQQVAGDQELRNIYSYETYLQENNPELYEWATSFNPYDTTTNAAGQNLNYAMVNEMLNVDEIYTEAERLIGADAGTIEKQFNGVYSTLKELESAYSDDDEDAIEVATDKYIGEMSKLVKDFGLEDDFVTQLNEMGYNVDSVESAMKQISDNLAKDESALQAQESEAGAGGAAAGGIIGGAAGFLGAAALLTNPAGWVVAAISLGVAAVGATIGYFVGESETVAGTEDLRDAAQAKAKNRYTALVDALVTMSKNKATAADESFYSDLADRPPSTDVGYNKNIKRGVDGTTYEYNIDGKAVTYLSSAILNDTVEDADGDNFEIEWKGETYDLEVTDESDKTKLDVKTQEKISKYVYESTGKALRPGDVFYYDNKLWVVTGEDSASRIRQVQNQFWDSSYNDLMTALNPKWNKVSTWNQ